METEFCLSDKIARMNATPEKGFYLDDVRRFIKLLNESAEHEWFGKQGVFPTWLRIVLKQLAGGKLTNG